MTCIRSSSLVEIVEGDGSVHLKPVKELREGDALIDPFHGVTFVKKVVKETAVSPEFTVFGVTGMAPQIIFFGTSWQRLSDIAQPVSSGENDYVGIVTFSHKPSVRVDGVTCRAFGEDEY